MSSLGLQFFTTRASGTLTPLVAVDELPAHVSIRGVARTLNASETQGMTSCGLAVQRTEPWTIDGLSTALPVVKNKEALAELKDLLTQIVNDESVSATLRLSVQAVLYKGLAEVESALTPTSTTMSPLAPAFNANNAQPARNNVLHPKKEYCSYWIRHGECDYSQQGCLYKHEMPLDSDLLDKLGLRDIPRWYRDKFGVESLIHPVQQQRATPRLAITEHPQPASPAIQYSSSTSLELKSSAPQAKQRSPARGPQNHGNNGGPSHSRGSRNQGWKGRQAKGKNVNPSPVNNEPNASFQSSGYESVSAPDNLAAFAGYAGFAQGRAFGTAMAPITAPAPFAMPALINTSTNLMDTGSSHRIPTVNADNLTVDADPFEHGFAESSTAVDKTHLKSKSRRLYETHKSNNNSSIDGGVRLPSDLFHEYGAFSALANLDDNANKSGRGTDESSMSNQATRASSKSPLSDIVSESNPLEENDVRDAWGPVGSPVNQSTGRIPDIHQHQRTATAIRGFPNPFNISHTH
ncbi:hypothetical protein N7467_001122 [Penicillium canescens]|nr:hypothetical protein N7467_001122 [Penicillium canescens]